MSTTDQELLLRFLENFTDINVIPVKLTPALPGYYDAIASDPELSAIALTKCDAVLQELAHHSPEIVARCSSLRQVIEASKQPNNLIQEQVDLKSISDMPFLSPQQHMANLIIEEIDLVDYVD
ncbi:LAFA_0G15830g1_1 [Lachancea sp. 'fantastica']|nr:LAFA_0G15830g1_1 [Lachancea sp. 'fantastica']